MKVYESGNPSNPAILLFPGTVCHWKRNFETVIPLLQQNFRVCAISYSGFDETEDTLFTDMIAETEQIETWIKEHHAGKVHAAYGCSLGGSFVGLLVQRGNIHINHAILGSSDLDQADGFKARLMASAITPILYRFLQQGGVPHWMETISRKKHDPAYVEKFIQLCCPPDKSMAFVKKESIHNQFLSDLVTPLDNGIHQAGTTIHCFWARKMGNKYKERYLTHFKNPVIHAFDMEHEELLLCHPETWTALVNEVCHTGA